MKHNSNGQSKQISMMLVRQTRMQLVNDYDVDFTSAIAMAVEIVATGVSVDEYLTEKGII